MIVEGEGCSIVFLLVPDHGGAEELLEPPGRVMSDTMVRMGELAVVQARRATCWSRSVSARASAWCCWTAGWASPGSRTSCCPTPGGHTRGQPVQVRRSRRARADQPGRRAGCAPADARGRPRRRREHVRRDRLLDGGRRAQRGGGQGPARPRPASASSPPPPAATRGRTVRVDPQTGIVLVREAGGKDAQLLSRTQQVPESYSRRWPEMARVLVVDDAAFMRKMVSDALVKAGHEVIGEACNGVEAVASFQSLKPELTTLDITMPEKDGLVRPRRHHDPRPQRPRDHVLRARPGVQGPGVDQARRARLRRQAVPAPPACRRRSPRRSREVRLRSLELLERDRDREVLQTAIAQSRSRPDRGHHRRAGDRQDRPRHRRDRSPRGAGPVGRL